ncbi:MAG: hypothetical protein V2A79_09250 [Planctomycetota bacterium]
MSALPKRKRPAHPPPVDRRNDPTVIMVTVCARKRMSCLANDAVHNALLSAWERAQEWSVGYYLIMPDHVHLFCAPGSFTPVGIKFWTKKWKGLASIKLGPKTWHWLPDCWDTQMRDYAHYVEKVEYVRRNPVRRGLVARHEEWPYQGEIHRIRW